ncbi:MAG: hypothetical protein ABFC90_04040 [Bacteroidales bacterium]|nr:hypothetical protein [Bacteroidales bacterium]
MIIAVDFDGTIVENHLPKIGKEFPFAVECLIRLQQEEQHQIILWTVREDELLDQAVEWCEKRGLVFYAINKNNPEEKAQGSRKLKVDLFIDDLNLGGIPEWELIYKMIKAQKFSRNYEEVYRSAFKVQEKAFLKRNFLLRLGTLFAEFH